MLRPHPFVTHVGEHRSAQFAFFQAKCERGQITGKGFHVMVVVLRILAQIVARQVARRPRPVKRMVKQVVFRDGVSIFPKNSAVVMNSPQRRLTTNIPQDLC